MGLFDRLKKKPDRADKDYQEALAQETSKVKAYRAAEEVAEASRQLMLKALELRAEIEAMVDD
jgi:hypothetical protein